MWRKAAPDQGVELEPSGCSRGDVCAGQSADGRLSCPIDAARGSVEAWSGHLYSEGPGTVLAAFAKFQPLFRIKYSDQELLGMTSKSTAASHAAFLGPAHLWPDPRIAEED